MTTDTRYTVEPHKPFEGLWHVRDTQFEGPGSVFDGPIKRVVTSEAAAQRIAAAFGAGTATR